MFLSNSTSEERKQIFLNLENYIETKYKPTFVKYLDLGVRTIKVVNYSEGFSHLIEKQLNFVLRDKAEKFDATLKVWQEDNIGIFPTKIIPQLNLKNNLKLRVDLLCHKIEFIDTFIFEQTYSKYNPILLNNRVSNTFSAQDNQTNTYYYAVQDLNPEEVIKEGHIFVQQISKIIKTDNVNLVHGACVGINGNGVLFCARGQRGKSTLSVLSLMKGFEYVSDDYLTLKKEKNKLYAYPIYSIITLSPKMYNTLFDELKDSRFLFNNARKDKYVFSIANFHKQFKVKYPINLCMFPEIVSDKDPSIVKCNKIEKGRAIVQLIQSSVSQIQSMNDKKVIKKLFDMVKDFDFYKINLCADIHKNTEYLRTFLKNYREEKDDTSLDKMLVDITFGLTNILDIDTYTIYTMNEATTYIYEHLLRGISKEEIINKLKTIKGMPLRILNEMDLLIKILKEKGLLSIDMNCVNNKNRSISLPTTSGYKLSFLEYSEKGTIDLIK